MTRKDYELIALAVLSAKKRVAASSSDFEAHALTVRGPDVVAKHLADALASQNPRFNRERFLKACGVAP